MRHRDLLLFVPLVAACGTTGATDTGCATDLATCQTSLDSAQSDLGTAQADLTTCEGSLDTAQSDLSTAQANLTTCESDKAATASDLAACQGDLDTAQSDLAAAQASLTTCNADLTTCDADLSDADAELARIADWISYDDGLRARLAASEGQLFIRPTYEVVGFWYSDHDLLVSNGVVVTDTKYSSSPSGPFNDLVGATTFTIDGPDVTFDSATWRGGVSPDGPYVLFQAGALMTQAADPSAWVVDAADAVTTGTWTRVVSDATDYLGDYYEDDGSGGASTVTFAPPDAFTAGDWIVAVLTARRGDAATNASFQLGSQTPVTIDLSQADQRVYLFKAPVSLADTGAATVTVDATGADGPVLVDAVVWMKP